MQVHLGKPQIDQRFCLEGFQDIVAAGSAAAEFVEQLNGFNRSHALRMPQEWQISNRNFEISEVPVW